MKKDMSNLEWYKERIKDYSLEGVFLYEFYYRKNFHRCWGNSFSIDCEGNVKPCLWSDLIFGNWKNGNIADILANSVIGDAFGIVNSLGKIEGCKDCIYRFGCKYCRVITEFLTGKRQAKNPLCEKE